MKACIILHNMIVEDERDSYDLAFEYEDVEGSIPEPVVRRDHHPRYAAYLRRVAHIRDPEFHAPSPIRFKARNLEAKFRTTRIIIVIVMYFVLVVNFIPKFEPYCIVI